MHGRCRSARPSTSRGRNMICPPAPTPTLMASDGSLTSQGAGTSPDHSWAFSAQPRSDRPVTRYRRVPSLEVWRIQSDYPRTGSARSDMSSGRSSEQALARLLEETIQEVESLQKLNHELAGDAKKSLFQRLKTYINKKRHNKVDVLPSPESPVVDLPAASNPWVTLSDGPGCLRLNTVLPRPAQEVGMERKGPGKIWAQSRALNASKQALASIPEETIQELMDELSWDIEDKQANKSPWKRFQCSFKRKKGHTADKKEDMTAQCCFPYLHFLRLLCK
ncbi:uncharacterized protein LOC117593799 [Esox lucius]|uniref:uncharacterized protein LOC117593798 n=1 Tax=Esox lucius TaxID=8010 RepID=UPI001476E123|nr:uncharacterized protein LOC117593798 [Esox lucius]XP_034146115.1 uncharacterized protein LOC117593799 [Esox lucius]